MKKNFKNFRKIGIITLLFILLLNNTVFATVGIEDEVSAYLLGDYETGEILEEYNVDQPVEVASITKLMSYLIIMDEVENRSISMEDMVYIDKDTTRIKGSSLNLEEGEFFLLEELLESVIVVSANDATYALSKHVGGTEEIFVEMMNKKAEQIGLKNSVFVNSTGLPQGEKQNIMSPIDIFTLSRYIINKYPEVVKISTIPYIEIASRNYRKKNTNPLLNEIEGIDGLKTGFTNKAGYCLVSTIGVNGTDIECEDFRLVSIVMGTESEAKRKELGKKLVEYGLDNYSKKILLDEDSPVDTIHLAKSRNKDIEVYPMRSFSTIVNNEDSIDIDTIIDEDLKFPLRQLDKIGKVLISKNDEVLEEIDLVVHADVKKQGIFMVIYDKLVELTYSLLSKIVG